MSLRQYSICVDEVEKETEEIAEIIFACKKSPYRTGLSSRVGLERRPFPAMPFQSALTTFDRDEPPHRIDHLGVVVALYLVWRGDG